ncbi:UNVERIFIED_CONTAM: hypothetical protein PYX00_010767 [Menopon gallinae]|uniref:Sulfatase N-terminal domain-containing protein n=1 Tax=Menopon gallinae TaxID=328185 RepID=A0AAW2HH98_9NEOP
MALRDVIYGAFVCHCLVGIAASFRRPNIVVIVADDLGWNDVSFHGSNQIPTPNIDALAYNGIILNSHYVAALCTPSRASLLTGKYPTSMGMQHLVILGPEPRGLPLTEKLMPEYLRRHGYATHAIGKWHLGFHKKEYTPTYRGFDTHFGYWNGYQDYFDHTVEDNSLEGAARPLKGYDMRRGLEVDHTSKGEYSTDAFTKEAVNVIKMHNSTRGPLFLYLSHLSPHSGNPDNPLQAPDDEIAKHAKIKDPERRVYAAMVTRLDAGVGKVMSALREADMLDNSIVLFMADNGAVTFGMHSNRGSNYPLRGLKESPWEGGVRGVAAIWSPLLNRTGRVSNQLMHISDWLPTLYSAAGLDTAELGEIDGMDLWDVLSNDRDSPRNEVFNNYDEIEGYSSLRVGPWKYIEGTAQAGDVDLWYGDSGRDHEDYDENSVLNSDTNIAITEHLLNKKIESSGKSVPPFITAEDIRSLRKETAVICESSPFQGTSSTNLTEEIGGLMEEIKRHIFREVEDMRFRFGVKDVTFRMDMLDDVEEANDLDEIFGCDPLKEICLFNLERDPCERTNLAKVFPEVVKSLQNRLKELKETVAKPLNLPGDPSCDPSLHNGTWSNWRDGHGRVVRGDLEEAKAAFVTVLENEFLAENAFCSIIFSPFSVLFNDSIRLFIHENSYLAIAILFGLSVFVYHLTKRFISFGDGDAKRSSVSMPAIARSSRFVKR